MKYLTLAEVYERLQSTSKRLDKTAIISEFLSKASPEEMQTAVLLLQGMIYPRSDEREIGVAAQMMLEAISVASGEPLAAVEKEFNAAGDLGLVAEKIVKKKTQKTLYQKELTVDKVFQNIRKLPEITGAGSVDRKIQLIAELLTSPGGALYCQDNSSGFENRRGRGFFEGCNCMGFLSRDCGNKC